MMNTNMIYSCNNMTVTDNNSHKTRNNTQSSKTRSSNTGSNIDTGRASTTGVDGSEGQCPEVLYLYC